MDFTGERMIPEQNQGDSIYVEHVTRYEFAAQFVKDKVVLDVACGVGYGSLLMVQSGARRVVGIDIDEETIEYAKRHYFHDQCEFRVGDAQSIPFEDHLFDVVVSFETIEHVENYRQFLSEVKRVLKPDGLFLVSTPNNTVYLPGNSFHLKEFSVEELKRELGYVFKNVSLKYQDTFSLNSIYRLVSELDGLNGKKDGLSKDPLYIIGICSDALALPDTPDFCVLGDWENKELKERDDRISRLNASSLEKDRGLQESRTMIEEKEASICELRSVVHQKEESLSERDDQIFQLCEEREKLRSQIDRLHLVVDEGERKMVNLSVEVGRKDGQILELYRLMDDREEKLEAYRKELERAQIQLSDVQDVLSDRESQMTKLIDKYEEEKNLRNHLVLEKDNLEKELVNRIERERLLYVSLRESQESVLLLSQSWSFRIGKAMVYPFRPFYTFFWWLFPVTSRRGLFFLILFRSIIKPRLLIHLFSWSLVSQLFHSFIKGDYRPMARFLSPDTFPPQSEVNSRVIDSTSPKTSVRWSYQDYEVVPSLPVSNVVDIIVCTAGNVSLLESCVRALESFTLEGSYRLHIVIHEKDVTVIPQWISEKSNVVCHSMKLFSFSQANNLVLKHITGDCVLLNDDVEVSAYWLELLQRASRGFSLVGSRTGVQCSGNPELWGKGQQCLTEYPLNMFCVYIPRRLLDVVGLLDEQYVYYGGEDVDYSCRVIQHGFPLVVSEAFVLHKASQSYQESRMELMSLSDMVLREKYDLAAPYHLNAIHPFVSVIIATKNRAGVLPKAVDSILSGEYKYLELIVVDDGSSDDTWNVIQKFQEKDSRVQAIRLSSSLGCVGARKKGVDISRGQFIAFMDDDDIALPHRISDPLKYLMNHPQIDVVYCGFEIVSGDTRLLGRTRSFDLEAYRSQEFDIGSGVLLIRRYVLDKVPFMRSYDSAIDYDWIFRLVRSGFKIDYCPSVVLEYSRNGLPDEHLSGNAKSIKMHEDICRREKLIDKILN